MIKNISEKNALLLLLTGLLVLFFLLSFCASGTFDSGDGIRHYLVSRYSWKHPDLLLYSWGKPFFTLISSPFSQFGLIGVNVFNLFCAILSSVLCFKLAKQLKLEYPFLVILFLFFTPIYFPTINSGLTEPFFGLVLIGSVYLMFRNNYFWATALVSLLPFVRTEGNLILPLFFIVLLYRKKLFLTPLLAFGTLAYTVIGYFYYKDLFWIKHQNPYTGSNYNIYGKGELFHFLINHDFIWGNTLGILFLLGCVGAFFLIFSSLKKNVEDKEKRCFLIEEVLLIYGSFTVYFVAHSIFWWKGLAGSLGLIRVLAGVMPCSALICLRGFNLIMLPFFKRNKFLESSIIVLFLFFIITNPFKQEYFPYKLDAEQTLIKDAGDWFKKSMLKDKKVFYLHPFLANVLDVDSFDPKKVGELWGLYPTIKAYGISSIPDSTVIFWDAHFGPNEAAIPLDSILNDLHFQLIKTFNTKEKLTVLGGYDFSVYVFMKSKNRQKKEVTSIDFYDLETLGANLLNTFSMDTSHVFSGKRSCQLSESAEYSVTVKKFISEVPANTRNIDISCKLLEQNNDSKDALVIMSVDTDSGKNLFWDGKSIVLNNGDNRSPWKNATAHFVVNLNAFQKECSIKFYLWNKAKKTFWIDDLKISYLGAK